MDPEYSVRAGAVTFLEQTNTQVIAKKRNSGPLRFLF